MTSCTSIESEIAALRADIAALNNKFASKAELENLKGQVVLKKEFESYKQYVEKNFDAIAKVTRYLVNQVRELTESRYREVNSRLDNAIDWLQQQERNWRDGINRKIDEFQKNNNNLHEWQQEQIDRLQNQQPKPPLPDLEEIRRKNAEQDGRLGTLNRELAALRKLIEEWKGSDKALQEMKKRIEILERALASERQKREAVDKELREAQERNKDSLLKQLEKRLRAERQARNGKDVDLEKQIDLIEDILKNRGDNDKDLRHLERQLGILKNALNTESKKRELMDSYLTRKLETVDDDWERQLNDKLRQEANKRNSKDNQIDGEIADLRKTLPTGKRLDRLEKEVDRIWADLRIKSAEIAKIKIDIGAIWAYLKTALPALINRIVWSILLSAAFNALIAGLMGAFNTKLAQDAWDLALKSFGLAKKVEGDANVAKELAVSGYSLANKANDKADIAINRIDGLKKEVDNIVAGALSAMQRLEDEIKFITEAARQAMLRLQSRIENLENYTGELSKIVGNLWSEISGLNARVSELTAFINTQIAEIQKTVTLFRVDLLTELAKLQKQIPEILGKIALFTAQIAGILVTIAGIQLVLKRLNPLTVINNNNFITNNNVVNNTNNNVVNNQNTTVVNNQVDNALLRKIDQTTTTNLGVSTTHLALGKVMDEKLGPAIMRGGRVIGLSGKLIQGFNWLIVDRALNVMTFGVTVHNAAMLSTNIVQTLTQAIQNVVDLVGLKDDNGNEFQVGEAINSAISNAVKSIVGKSNYDYWIKQWNYYNRIYQAGANLFSSLLSMGDTMVNALNTISGQNAKIANALKIWGVVGEKAYGWMNITPNFNNPLITKLNNFEETASMVEQVTQEPLNIKSAKEGLEQATKDTYDAIEQKPGTESKQGKEVPEAIKVKADEDKKTTESKGIAKLLEDAYPDDDE